MTAHILGTVAPGFEPIADRFLANWRDHSELGAAVAISVNGEMVVDLWGGIADRQTGRAWSRETPVLGFSVSKGISAALVHRLAQLGILNLDVPITQYWPAFGTGGKQDIPLSWVLSHRAGLAYVDQALTMQDVCDGVPLVQALEAQTPNWEPGSTFAYHAITFGALLAEAVARTSGSTFAQLFQDEFAIPLGLNAWFGLPAERVSFAARIDVAEPGDDRAWRALTVNGALRLPVGSQHQLDYNRGEVLRASLPAAGLVADARSLARLYASLVGEVDGVRSLDDDSVRRAMKPRSTEAQLFDLGAGGSGHWGEGFQLASERVRPMLGASSFGHDGASGALAFADAQHRVGFAYLTNRMGVPNDDRADGLARTLAAVLTHKGRGVS